MQRSSHVWQFRSSQSCRNILDGFGRELVLLFFLREPPWLHRIPSRLRLRFCWLRSLVLPLTLRILVAPWSFLISCTTVIRSCRLPERAPRGFVTESFSSSVESLWVRICCLAASRSCLASSSSFFACSKRSFKGSFSRAPRVVKCSFHSRQIHVVQLCVERLPHLHEAAERNMPESILRRNIERW